LIFEFKLKFHYFFFVVGRQSPLTTSCKPCQTVADDVDADEASSQNVNDDIDILQLRIFL